MDVPPELSEAAARILERAPSLAQAQIDYLSDIIRLRSYTGEEEPAVMRTLAEMESGGFDDVRHSSAGDALGRVGSGQHHLLYDAHLDHNEVADESDWLYPPLEPTIADGKGVKHSWREDLCGKLISLQNKDGSWVNTADRWYEGNPALVTAYAVLALQTALE